MENIEKSLRLESLDVLRGADMFFIMGGAGLFIALSDICPVPFFQAIAAQMYHAEWNGLTHHDTIFPLFLFIAGISFPFSFAKQCKQGRSKFLIMKKVLLRSFKLILLGLVYNGLLQNGFEDLRYASVLGRIGIAWMLAALLYIYTNTVIRIVLFFIIIIGYWLLLVLIPAPDNLGMGTFTMEGSLVGYIDRQFLPGRLYCGIHDPEGLLPTIPAVATALIGVFVGEFIRIKENVLTNLKKVMWLLLVGIIFLFVGLLWDSCFPINKNLWTSSFVCVVGGYSMIVFAFFFLIVDVWKLRKWGFFFKVIGMNSITIYMAQYIIDFSYTSNILFGFLFKGLPNSLHAFMGVISYIIICWLFLYILYKKKIFLKV